MPLVVTLVLSWCWSSWDGKEVAEKTKEPVKEVVAEVNDKVKAPIANEKVKEVIADEIKEAVNDEVKNPIPEKEDKKEDTAPAKKSIVWHDDTLKLFDTENFLSTKEMSIDGYDIVIKHKDTHAWEKLTWTATITQWWKPITGFEKINGDMWVGIVRDPVDHDEHVHPLANTNNTLTFSVHTHDAWKYRIITQFQHQWKKITIPYAVDLIANTANHHN